MIILGVDPGLSGALAVVDDGGIREILDMPTVLIRRGKTDKAEVIHEPILKLALSYKLRAVFVEQVGGLPGQSASAAFNFGRAAAAPEYLMRGMHLRVERVPPQRWQKALNVPKGKDGSREMAARLWPKAAGLFSRKKDDGRAEAALIAEYGRRLLLREKLQIDDFFA